MRRALGLGLTVLLLAAICVVEGSAKKKPTVPLDPKFMAIQNISVLPVVDSRAGEKTGVNMVKLQGSVVKGLMKKHYPVNGANTSGDAGQIAVEDLEDAQASYLKKLGPTSERWVMVVLLDDIHSKIVFGSTGNAELDAYLFDKDSGELLWKGKGVGQAGQGGLIGMSMKGMMKSEALDAAVRSLLGSMPNRPKPGK
jgi:hypothetical protein